MPEYLYQHPTTEKVISVIQGINDEHSYTEDGVEWNRIFTSPQLNTVGTIDPFDQNQFINSTSDTKGTYGDLIDRSKELSEKRKEKLGHDPVLDKHLKNYSEKRGGKAHPNDPRRVMKSDQVNFNFD